MELPVLECIPNVSEGRDPRVIDTLAAAVRSVPAVHLADVHVDPDHHRSVFTFLGPPEAVEAAALALADVALREIDMRTHRGVHPRIGVLDVLPFVPLRAFSMAETVAVAHHMGRALGSRFDLPVFFYAEAALSPGRRRLHEIRRGGYERLDRMLVDPAWRPDAGPARPNPRSGATAVGARGVLVAFNVWLDSDDVCAAQAIARVVRESSGGLPAVQAMGVPLARERIVQVSLNLLDYRRTSLPRVFERVKVEAGRRGISIRRSELVGLAPREAFEGAAPESLGLPDFTPATLLETYLSPESGGVSRNSGA